MGKSRLRRTAHRVGACWLLLVSVVLVMVPRPGLPFALLADPRTGDPALDLEATARWSPAPDPFGFGTGFHDGLQVAVAPDFAKRFGATTDADVAEIREVIRRAFAAWETPDVRFDIDFDRVPVRGTGHDVDSGSEFDLFAVSASDPAFNSTAYFGVTFVNLQEASQRLLSNGTRFDGFVITGADIFINVDLALQTAALFPPERWPAALQRLLMHEIGHGLGLAHPNTYNSFCRNYDTDDDPLNPMVLDPRDPFAALMYSENRDAQAIMSNDRTELGPFIFYTELQYDDRGGRDALYPSLKVCPGDCGGDGRVDIAEILTAVAIALENRSVAPCVRADGNGDGRVSIDEIMGGVGSALNGCRPTTLATPTPGPPRPTRTPTPTPATPPPTRTPTPLRTPLCNFSAPRVRPLVSPTSDHLERIVGTITVISDHQTINVCHTESFCSSSAPQGSGPERSFEALFLLRPGLNHFRVCTDVAPDCVAEECTTVAEDGTPLEVEYVAPTPTLGVSAKRRVSGGSVTISVPD
jgi:hypothetical protein